jgi:hypothetical protein
MTTPGFTLCPDCHAGVLLALAATGDVIAFDASFEDGPWGVAWDVTHTPRCRELGPRDRERDGEYRYSLHRDSCAALARVIPIAATRRLDRPERRRRYA